MATRPPRQTSQNNDAQIGLFRLPDTPDPFRKAVQVVHSKPRAPMTLLQRKLANVWLKYAMTATQDEQGFYTIPITALTAELGFDSNNRDHLKQAAERLMRVIFEWDVVAPEHKRIFWKASVLFPEVEMRSDVIRYAISRQLHDHVLNPEIYAVIDMNVERRFRKAASIPLYEHCARFVNVGVTTAMPWRELKDILLSTADDQETRYTEYKYFKQKVLNPCSAEINAESPLNIVLLETRVGRSIDKIQFAVEKKINAEPLGEVLETEDHLEAVGEMVRFGVPQSEAKKLTRQYRTEELKAAINFTKKRASEPKAAKLENPAAYFRQALAQGWGLSQEVKPKRQQKDRSDGGDPLEEAFAAHRSSEAQNYFNELDAPEQARLLETYNDQQTVPQLKVTKKGSKLSQTAFLRWLAVETWGEPTPTELLKFAKAQLRKQA